jgi:hypothetical protein
VRWGGLGLGVRVGVGVTPDLEGIEDDKLTLVEEQATATADTTSNSNASIKLSTATPFYPTGPNRLLPATLQHVYIQHPLARPRPCCYSVSHHPEISKSAMDELRAIEGRDERVVVLDWRKGGWRIEDIVRGWDEQEERVDYES